MNGAHPREVREKPYLLVDVDGVLATSRPTPTRRHHEVTDRVGRPHSIWLDSRHGSWLRVLDRSFDLAWATGWEHDAKRILEPLLGCPPMSVIEFTARPRLGQRLPKLHDVAAFVGERAAAWVDDELGSDEYRWAKARTAPTLLIQPDPDEGISESHVEMLLEFARNLGGQTAERS